MLLNNCSILVEPRSATVTLLVPFKNVSTTVKHANLNTDYIVAQEDLSPATSITPLLLAAANHAKTILVTILLHLKFSLMDEAPNIEGTESLPMF